MAKGNRGAGSRQLHRLVRCGAWQHAGREPNRLRNHQTHRHSSAWNQNAGESAIKKQRVAQNALAREVGVPLVSSAGPGSNSRSPGSQRLPSKLRVT